MLMLRLKVGEWFRIADRNDAAAWVQVKRVTDNGVELRIDDDLHVLTFDRESRVIKETQS